MSEKIILPNEVRVCATCSYWDGERQVDDDMHLVVVDERAVGECIVKEKNRAALTANAVEHSCLWEDLEPESADEATQDVSANVGQKATPPLSKG